jgi:hypothetical protein
MGMPIPEAITMAFMIPVAEYLTMYHVETREAGTEYVPQEACGNLDLDGALDDVTAWSEQAIERLRPHLEGHTIDSVDERTGWYGCLSAPGYLDCTPWMGPYLTQRAALSVVREEYEVDGDGDPLDDIYGVDDEPCPITRREGRGA